jgi:uncharacterized protein
MNASATAPSEELEPAPAAGTPDQPVSAGERLVALDFIRGIAVLGILFANITAFGHPLLAYFWPDALPSGGSVSDRWMWLFQFVFVDGKFRGLFTLLFGAGMYLFMERTWSRGGSRALQARRLVWLMLFGLAHFFLLFIGDILFLYSVSGFLVLAMLRWSARTQLWIGLIWYVVGSLAFTLAVGSQAAFEGLPELRAQSPESWQQVEQGWQDQVDDAEAEASVIREGSYADIVTYRVVEQGSQLALYAMIAIFETIPLMLVGIALYRFGFFAGALDRRKMRRWGWIGLASGALVSLALGGWALARDFPPFLTQFVFNGPSAFPRIAMVVGLASLLVLWAPAAASTSLGSRFVAAGRMAFSNYIGTSVMMVLVFQGWAGGLYGELDRVGLLVVVVLAWALMLAWSKPWLERFRYGPLEWLWRCLTYGRVFAMRR